MISSINYDLDFQARSAFQNREWKWFRDNPSFITLPVCCDIIYERVFDLFPYLSFELNKKDKEMNVPNYFFLDYDRIDLETISKLVPYLDFTLKYDKHISILEFTRFDDIRMFKLIFDKFQRRGIFVDNDSIFEIPIKSRQLEHIEFLKMYYRLTIDHLILALKTNYSVEMLKDCFMNSFDKIELPDWILKFTIYNPDVFEFIFKKIEIESKSVKLFYDLIDVHFAVHFLFESDIPKPPLEYLALSPFKSCWNDKYYQSEIKFVENLFCEKGIGKIILSYIY